MVEGERWQVKVNDFPEQHLYSLLVDGVPAEEFDEWPTAWTRPGPGQGGVERAAPEDEGEDLHEKAEYDMTIRKMEREKKIGPSERVERADEGVWWKSVRELFDYIDAKNVEDLAKAERRAAEIGVEPFSLARLEELLGAEPGSRANREKRYRAGYYLSCLISDPPEFMTLAEFAEYIRVVEFWED
jgi:hypothetical protein